MRYLIESIFIVLIVTGVVAIVARCVGLRVSRGRGGTARPADGLETLRLRQLALLDLTWAVLLLVHFVLLAALSDAKEIASWLANLGALVATGALVAAALSLWRSVRGELQAARRDAQPPA